MISSAPISTAISRQAKNRHKSSTDPASAHLIEGTTQDHDLRLTIAHLTEPIRRVIVEITLT